MAKAHRKLVETNRIILRNSDTLEQKLKTVETTINTQVDRINNQSDLIARLELMLCDVEKRYKVVSDNLDKNLDSTVAKMKKYPTHHTRNPSISICVNSENRNNPSDNEGKKGHACRQQEGSRRAICYNRPLLCLQTQAC